MGASRLAIEWLGRLPYAEALETQRKAVDARSGGVAGDRLLLLEHPAVVTLGRSSHEEHLLCSREELAARGIEVHEIARGGDVTYHAPGQLVGYPILDLAARGRDLHAYLRSLEETLIAALACLGVKGARIEGKTGVFVEREAGDRGPDRKIASIGVGVRRWVSYHGFALNVSLDLSGFDAIVACGLQGVEMTSIAREWQRRGRAPCSSQELGAATRDAVERAFRARFD